MADPKAEQAPMPVRKWRALSNHAVTRVMPNSARSIPCYCWATATHSLGDEVRNPPGQVDLP